MNLAFTTLEVVELTRDIVLIAFFLFGSLGMVVAILLGLTVYRKTRDLVERVDSSVKQVEAMVDKVDSTTESVKKTATSVNRGMRAGTFARSAVSSVFGRRDEDEDDKEPSDGGSDGKKK